MRSQILMRLNSLLVQIVSVIGILIFATESTAVSANTLFTNLTDELVRVSFPLNLLSLIVILFFLGGGITVVYLLRNRSSNSEVCDKNEGDEKLGIDQLKTTFKEYRILKLINQ